MMMKLLLLGLVAFLPALCLGQEATNIAAPTVTNVTNIYNIPAQPSPPSADDFAKWGERIGLLLALAWGIYVSWRKRTGENLNAKVVGVLKDNIDSAKAVIEGKVSTVEKDAYVETIKQAQESAGVRDEVRKAP